MQFLAIAALLFVARVSAEQPQEVSNAQPVPVSVGPQPQNGPVSQVVPVVSVEPQQGPQHVQGVHHYSPAGQYQQQQQVGVSQYSPSGMVHVVNAADGKPYVQSAVQGVPHYASAGPVQVGSGANSGNVEQYGQPEPAGIPPNYKPFGSWGLYIGGNPADGYYSNYYKALSSSVDKQQVSSVEPQSAKPGAASAAGVHQASAFGPMVKQASYPYSSYNSYQDQVYPFDYYTTADLNSGSRIVAVDTQPAAVAAAAPSTYVASGRMSPVQMGAQVYGSPIGAEGPSSGPSQYADSSFASKRSTKDNQVQQQVQPPSGKGFAQKRYGYGYVYSPAAPQYGFAAPVPAPAGQQQAQPQPQVFAYPVPVGSQIVGSQPGAEGSFQPYGVHGYTRYAVKPTVVAHSEQQAYYGVQSSPQYPVYKQYGQQQQQQYPTVYQQAQQQAGQQQPHQYAPASAGASFYGYPVSQLHYSQGSIVPAFQPATVVEHQQQGNGVVGVASPVSSVVQPEGASSEKSETEVAKPETVQPKQHHQPAQTQQQQQQQQQKRA